ncbi:MAG: hypothetical protein KGL39_03200 [Patescibacteria group bacterium]|nr:hypothetical protein [Patescibacteria group bacterium]
MARSQSPAKAGSGAGPGGSAAVSADSKVANAAAGVPSVNLTGELPKKDYMLEAGNSGLRIFGGYVVEEFDPNLRGMRGARMFREMSDSSPTIGAFLYVIFQAIGKLGWHLQPADQTPLSLLAQELIESMMDDMEHSWDEFIQEALTMVIYGYAPVEIVLKMRNGQQPDKRFSSKYDDGAIGIRKLALRSQETILRWVMDADNNDVLGVVQMPWTGGVRMIPRTKFIHFRTRSYRNNPEGRSLLRNAYRPYYFAKRVEEIEGIGIERDLAGFPVMLVPGELIAAAANGTDPNAPATLQSYKNLVKNIKRNSQEGAVLPSDRDEHGQLQFELKLLASSGKRQFDTNVTIERYQQQMASVTLADFLLMGHGSMRSGGQALSSDKIEMFYASIEGIVQTMCDAIQADLINLLCDLNGIPEPNRPTLYTDKAEQVDLGRLGAYINALAASGMVLFPNQDLENYLLSVAGLPEPTEDTLAQQTMLQSTGAEAGQPGTGGAAQPGALTSSQGQPAAVGPGAGSRDPAGGPGADTNQGAQGAGFGQQSNEAQSQRPHMLPQQSQDQGL